MLLMMLCGSMPPGGDVFAGGDQADAGVLEGSVDFDVVGAVVGEAVEFVDDGVVDLAVLCEVGQHLLQLEAVGAAGGLAASFSGRSTTSAPIVIAVPATEAAFCSASLVTRTKLTTPAALRSISSPGVLTLIPAPLRLLQRNIITSSCQCSLVLRLGRRWRRAAMQRVVELPQQRIITLWV